MVTSVITVCQCNIVLTRILGAFVILWLKTECKIFFLFCFMQIAAEQEQLFLSLHFWLMLLSIQPIAEQNQQRTAFTDQSRFAGAVKCIHRDVPAPSTPNPDQIDAAADGLFYFLIFLEINKIMSRSWAWWCHRREGYAGHVPPVARGDYAWSGWLRGMCFYYHWFFKSRVY